MHERGLRFNYDPFFDSLVPGSWSGLTAGVGVRPEETDIALARTELRWRPMPVNATPLRFSLNQVDGCLRLDAWSGDAGLLPRSELEPALLAVERLLVAAAHGDVPAGQVPEVIGLEPIAGTPDRVLADSCWVEVADVQRLVDEAVAPAVARVFASAGGLPLVAYLAATDRSGRPNRRTPAAWPPSPATPPPSPPATTSSAPPHRPTRPTPPPGHHPDSHRAQTTTGLSTQSAERPITFRR